MRGKLEPRINRLHHAQCRARPQPWIAGSSSAMTSACDVSAHTATSTRCRMATGALTIAGIAHWSLSVASHGVKLHTPLSPPGLTRESMMRPCLLLTWIAGSSPAMTKACDVSAHTATSTPCRMATGALTVAGIVHWSLLVASHGVKLHTPLSPPGLTRGSMVRPCLLLTWIAGSSPAMTDESVESSVRRRAP